MHDATTEIGKELLHSHHQNAFSTPQVRVQLSNDTCLTSISQSTQLPPPLHWHPENLNGAAKPKCEVDVEKRAKQVLLK